MNTTKAIVWTTVHCMQCRFTTREMDKAGIVYETRDLADHPEQVEAFKAAGFMSAPIVQAAGETWAGYQPQLIQSIAA